MTKKSCPLLYNNLTCSFQTQIYGSIDCLNIAKNNIFKSCSSKNDLHKKNCNTIWFKL